MIPSRTLTKFGGRSFLALALCGALAACQSGKTEGQKSVDELSSLVSSFAKTLQKSQDELGNTMTEHGAIIENKDGDLPGHYKRFSKGIVSVEKNVAKLGELSTEIQVVGQPFFAKWELDLQAITSEDLRGRSEKRMQETRGRFDEMVSDCNQAKDSFEPILSTLRDHSVYLANDLNIEAARSLAKDTRKLNEKVSELGEFAQKTIASTKSYNDSVAMHIEAQPAAAPK